MIKRETIEDFIKLMVEHDLVELDVADGEQSITLRRAEPGGSVTMVPSAAPATTTSGQATGNPGTPAAASAPEARDTGQVIKSPMVGTFYSKSSPDADPFIAVGSKVNDSTVVCLVEAMKVFNEIKAECKGQVREILVNDGDPVEFNQPLFRLESA